MDKPEAILFDWDGTLYDSVKLCFKIYLELFKRFGIPEITYDQFRQDFTADYHQYQQKNGLGADRWNEFDSLWYDLYYSREKESKPFPFVKEVLDTLSEQGTTLGIVTNTNKKRMEKELTKLNLSEYFRTVVTLELSGNELKPSPRPVQTACRNLGIEPQRAIYIGDMAEDIMSGKRAGTMTGAVCTGIHKPDRLITQQPDFIFWDIRGVLEVME